METVNQRHRKPTLIGRIWRSIGSLACTLWLQSAPKCRFKTVLAPGGMVCARCGVARRHLYRIVQARARFEPEVSKGRPLLAVSAAVCRFRWVNTTSGGGVHEVEREELRVNGEDFLLSPAHFAGTEVKNRALSSRISLTRTFFGIELRV